MLNCSRERLINTSQNQEISESAKANLDSARKVAQANTEATKNILSNTGGVSSEIIENLSKVASLGADNERLQKTIKELNDSQAQAAQSETGLTANETTQLGNLVDTAKAAGSTLSEGASAIEAGEAGDLLAGAEGVSAALDATGALAPVGVVLGIFSFLGTEVASAVEGFKAHHETDNVNINTQNMTQMAYDPTST